MGLAEPYTKWTILSLNDTTISEEDRDFKVVYQLSTWAISKGCLKRTSSVATAINRATRLWWQSSWRFSNQSTWAYLIARCMAKIDLQLNIFLIGKELNWIEMKKIDCCTWTSFFTCVYLEHLHVCKYAPRMLQWMTWNSWSSFCATKRNLKTIWICTWDSKATPLVYLRIIEWLAFFDSRI